MKHTLILSDKYDDIIHLEHYKSKRHPQMSIQNRAAQFSPFAALTGYESAILEKARVTKHKPELDENKISILNEKLTILHEQLKNPPLILLTYFKKDLKKEGGEIIQKQGYINKVNLTEHTIYFNDMFLISIDCIIDISFI